MHVGECLNDVLDILDSFLDAQTADFVETVEQRSSVEVLHHQVDVIALVEHSEEFDDIGMIEARMQSDFFYELIHHLEFLYL